MSHRSLYVPSTRIPPKSKTKFKNPVYGLWTRFPLADPVISGF